MAKYFTWVIDVNGKYLGKCFATLAEIEAACGPWCVIRGNHVNIFASPLP